MSCDQGCDQGLPGIAGRSVEAGPDQASDQLGRFPVAARRAVPVDLHRDALVRVADAVADDLCVDAAIQRERRVGVADVVQPAASTRRLNCSVTVSGWGRVPSGHTNSHPPPVYAEPNAVRSPSSIARCWRSAATVNASSEITLSPASLLPSDCSARPSTEIRVSPSASVFRSRSSDSRCAPRSAAKRSRCATRSHCASSCTDHGCGVARAIRARGIPSAEEFGVPTILAEARVVAETLRADGMMLRELQQSIADLHRSVEELAAQVGATRQERRRDNQFYGEPDDSTTGVAGDPPPGGYLKATGRFRLNAAQRIGRWQLHCLLAATAFAQRSIGRGREPGLLRRLHASARRGPARGMRARHYADPGDLPVGGAKSTTRRRHE
jgi:hypothetical protein